MKIKSIELNNYRLYYGKNIVVFPNGNNKNLHLISGENGFGKTTFLHSLLWCLYGRLMSDVDETFRKDISNGGYNATLIANLNEICRNRLNTEIGTNKISKIKKKGYSVDTNYIREFSSYSVSLEFIDVHIPSIPSQSLKITRSFDVILNQEEVEILIDGVKSELTSEIGNEIFINDFILNKDIARFFFFDSEKIVLLAETNTMEEKRRLSSAYNEVLGVKKYEDLKKNLENMRLRFRRKSDDIETRNILNELLSKQKLLNEKNKEIEKQSIILSDQIFLLKKEDEDLQIQLLREGNSVTVEEFNRQKLLLSKLQEKDTNNKQKLKHFLEFAPFAISGELLLQTKRQLERDIEIIQSQNDIKNQNILLSKIYANTTEAINKMSLTEKDKNQIIHSFKSIITKYQSNKSDEKCLINLSKQDFDEFISVFSNITTTYRIEFEHLADDYRKNKQILDRTSRNLSNMKSKENDDVIKSIRKKKNEIERKITDFESKIRILHEKKGAINKELSVLERKISELSKTVNLDDNVAKKDEVAEQLINELNIFLGSLKKEKKLALETRIKTTLNNLMHKSDFIGEVNVVIEEDIIDINLLSKEGYLIKKESLSKGEQQLYATSLLKALVEESGIEFPVFIDSPLQKFDKSHANKIITEFYPTISKQVVLFPLLHKELSESDLEVMKPHVNSVYLLRNKNSKSYIERVEIENLMKY